MKLSHDERVLLQQANRRLSNMRKRVKFDKNLQNTIDFAMSDIRLSGGKDKYIVRKGFTERQKNAMLRSASQLIESPYSTYKGTQDLYRRQRQTLAKTFDITEKQAKELINLFDEEKNPETAEAWKRIRGETRYNAISPIIKDSYSGTIQNIGTKKFGQLIRLYTEASLQSSEYSFANLISDPDIIAFFESHTSEEINNFIESMKALNVNEMEVLQEELTAEELSTLLL